jgi:hypothetical protein
MQLSTTGLAVTGALSATGDIAPAANITYSSGAAERYIQSANGQNFIGFNQSTGAVRIAAGNSVVGTFTAGNLAVIGALSSTTGANFATSSGNVGIGTASSAEKLHVVGGNIAVDSGVRKIGYITDATASNTGYIIPYDASGFLSIHTNFASGGIKFHTSTSNTERMRIDSSGNVGIGTASPGSKLDVNGELRIGNTVNTVSPTSPNRTVTIVIGGTTYYLAAKTTND